MNFLSLFSGIGGFDIAARNAGISLDNHYFSEIDKDAIGIYRKHFPGARALGDVRTIDYSFLPRGEWIIAGSPPCQPFSNAGGKKGKADNRNLFPETIRAIHELRPCIAIFENVFEVLDYVDGKYYPRLKIVVTKRKRFIYLLEPSALTIEEGDCGLLPTPTASMWKHGWGFSRKKRGRFGGGRYSIDIVNRALSLSGGWTPSVPQVEAMMGFPKGWVSSASETR